MNTELKKNTIVVFAESAHERDYYRDSLSKRDAIVFCFDKELSCFDNLITIRPEIIIIRTDSVQMFWRFVFAIKANGLKCYLLVASELLDVTRLDLSGVWFSVFGTLDELNERIDHFNSILPITDKVADKPYLVGQSAEIQNIKALMPIIVGTYDPILITGEPGTGKDLLVRRIVADNGQNAAFIKFNCAELGTELIAKYRIDEYMANDSIIKQYWNSHSDSPVLFVVFFDRINELQKSAQSEILLLLDDAGKLFPKNYLSSQSRIRIIATSEVDLEPLIESGQFRKDLYYRLNVIPIFVPPLKKRKEDIPLLMDFFMINACAQSHKSYMTISTKARESMTVYDWPGNIDELKKLIQRIEMARDEEAVLENTKIPCLAKNSCDALFQAMDTPTLPDYAEIKESVQMLKNISLKSICDRFIQRTEKNLLTKALSSTNWNRKKAAALLNISYKSMLNKMKMYEIV